MAYKTQQWALGVITYEFLYGAPPFHEETPEKVFENILSRRIEWLEEYTDYSPEARDLMERLLSVDPIRRLGANGAEEVKAHPWFSDIEWDKVTAIEAAFIPQVTDPESTDYFDPRGAILQLFEDDPPVPISQSSLQHNTVGIDIPHSEAISVPRGGRDASTLAPADDEFGTFSFKNLPLLKQANDDVIRKLRTDQMAPSTHTLSESGWVHTRNRSMSAKSSFLVASIDLKRGPDPTDRAGTCLLAEDNPITAKIIETLLSRLGCRCVVVADGSEAIGVAMGDISWVAVHNVVRFELTTIMQNLIAF